MTSIRLPEGMETRLDELCAITKRSKSFYIKEALEKYLEDISDSYIAMDRITRPNRKLLSTQEAIKRIRADK